MRRMKYRAPKAGALPGCATPRRELLNHSKALCNFTPTWNSVVAGGCARIKRSLEYECVAPNFCSVQIFKQDGRTSSLLAACGRRDLAELSACVLHGMCRAPHW